MSPPSPVQRFKMLSVQSKNTGRKGKLDVVEMTFTHDVFVEYWQRKLEGFRPVFECPAHITLSTIAKKLAEINRRKDSDKATMEWIWESEIHCTEETTTFFFKWVRKDQSDISGEPGLSVVCRGKGRSISDDMEIDSGE